MTAGMYLLRVRCMRRPAVLRTGTQLVRAASDIGEGAIVLIAEERFWPIGGRRRTGDR